MILTIHDQVFYFLFSAICGVVMGFVYDLFRVKRIFLKTTKASILFDDLFYWMIIGGFLLAINHHVLKGQLRFFMLLGLILGSVIYLITLSKLLIKVFVFLINLILKPFQSIRKVFTRTLNLLSKRFQ
jgi:spore cortex biosynthesis protein YabQ